MSDGQQNSHHPIGYCKGCQYIFIAAVIALEPGATVTFRNCGTNCPSCGNPAAILDGEYSAFVGEMRALLSPELSPEVKRAILRLLYRVQRNEISLRQAQQSAEAIHPRLGRIFDISSWSDQAKAVLLAACITTFGTFINAKFASPPSITIHIELPVSPAPVPPIPSKPPNLRKALRADSDHIAYPA